MTTNFFSSLKKKLFSTRNDKYQRNFRKDTIALDPSLCLSLLNSRREIEELKLC